MKICVSCREEMRCVKTGCITVWGGTHVYRGDEYECSQCKAKIRVLSGQSYHDSNAMSNLHDLPLDMSGE